MRTARNKSERKPAPWRRIRRSDLRLGAFFALFSTLCVAYYLYISVHLAAQERAFAVVETLTEAQSAFSALDRAIEAHPDHAKAGGEFVVDIGGASTSGSVAEDAIRAEAARLASLWSTLSAEFSGRSQRVGGASPGARLVNALALDRPPDVLKARWEAAMATDGTVALLTAASSNDAVIRTLSAASAASGEWLETFRAAAVVWRDEAVAQTHFAALAGLAGVLSIGVLVLTGFARPLLRRARGAKKALAFQNEMLEVQVAARTSELSQALKRAEVGSRVKSEFLRSLSHEVRTPMNGVIGAAAVMEGMELHESARNFVALIRQSSARMMAYLDTVIEMAELSAAPVTLNPGPATLDLVLSDLGAEFANELEEKGVAFIYDVPAGDAPEIEIDGVRVRQIAEALLRNAVAYTDCGFVALRARAEARSGLCDVVIEVEDSGAGIAVGDQTRIFDRFVRLDQTGENLGAGLGLSICRLLVEALGGSIEVVSEPEEGSLFRVRFSAPATDGLAAVA